MTRILQISDLHIMPEGQLFQDAIDTAAALRQMLSGLAGLLPAIGPVERLVISGDLTETGCKGAYDHLRDIMAEVALPWRAIPGNHDCREAMRAFAAQEGWMPDHGPINWREDLDDVTILGLDTLVEGAAHGAVTDATLAWLEATLRDLRHRPVLIFMHHPPVDTGISAMDAIGLAPNPGFEGLLRDHDGPVQIACGHVHRMITGQFAGHPVTIAPGTSHAVGFDLRMNAGITFIPGHSGAILHDIGSACRTLLISADDLG
ncbi:MAG: phosphodiesterase [Pseudomonadota bacterium]|uniref:phosphodiesterase n=1 Tax=Roseovarius salincola TaxID=2978479 RepID=UPI0022A81447|nr:phosphodiesterase [Roseovarius sp. EGI FJ00037]MCZ0813189.1 phosphodiesterase [Roseovarius sp. EGI FJ00037]